VHVLALKYLKYNGYIDKPQGDLGSRFGFFPCGQGKSLRAELRFRTGSIAVINPSGSFAGGSTR
jgi:hypothetical protein